MNDLRDYFVIDTLRNGTTVTIRAIRPEDIVSPIIIYTLT